MIPLLRPAAVRDLDARAVAGGVSVDALMARAGGHLARAAVAAGGRGYGLRVALLCGKGNNGGDGFTAGIRLLDAGAQPRVCLVGGETDLSAPAAAALRRYRAAGGRVVADAAAALDGAAVAVDCLLGTGAAGAPREPYAGAIRALNDAGTPHRAVVACDLPSGVDADTGAVPGVAVRADVTVTLGAHKRGLWLEPARGHCGRIVLGDLGLAVATTPPAAVALERDDVARLVPAPPADADKRTRGVVVILAGSPGMSGAATLVARGAMAFGAGLVTVATSAAARDLVAATVPEALTVDLPDGDPDAAFARLAGRLDGADALAVGPGLGHDDAAVALVRRVVAEVDLPLVLDADGLNAFRGDGDALAVHASRLLVCTLHGRELARLVGAAPDAVAAERVALPERARRWDAVVVAKGPGSLVAAPDGRVWINPTGGPALATGGTGDVLTGMAVAAVAQRPDAEQVAAAVWLHGLAGQLAGAGRAARSATAADIAAAVPAALRTLGAAA